MNTNTFKLKLGDKEIIAEAKNLAEQANGNILMRCGDTLLLTTCVMGKRDREDLGFFPLTVEYEEKYYAAGKIKGARYIRREGRPSDEAICNSRLIDRAIRPRFPKSLAREVQVITTVLSWDEENDPDTLGLIGASTALSISDIPWEGPIGIVRVCRANGGFILNPTYKEREDNDFDIVFAGLLEGNDLLINMVEGNFKETDEESILKALDFAEEPLRKIIGFQKEIAKKIGKEKTVIASPEKDLELEKEMTEFLKDSLEKAIYQKDKNKRSDDLDEVKSELISYLEEKYPEDNKNTYAGSFLERETNRLIHENIIKYDKRPDGRKLDEVREISCEAGLLPRTHGSGLFCRGKTKALSILTLGAPGDQQIIEGMEIVGMKHFMHHYNFPGFSVGEPKPLRGPGRREIGHGRLAEKALLPLLPSLEDFPYTIRIVSEMLSSNGSTSMASISGASLALMDAGVPLKSPAAGIAIGLAKDEETKDYKILTDIQGPEDHHCDMDFKVAGTKKGITVVQMDVKIDGINREIVEKALNEAKKARIRIIDTIEKTIDKPREELSQYAPKIIKVQISPDKIREVIGPGGKIINGIIDATGAAIDIQDSGLIFITAETKDAAEKAANWVKDIVREVQAGEVFEGEVKRILDFGAFVEVLPGKEGLVHISKLAEGRVEKVTDVVNIGDMVSVKVLSIDDKGRIDLTLIKNNKKH